MNLLPVNPNQPEATFTSTKCGMLFFISRVKRSKGQPHQIRFNEYISKSEEGGVKALATLHFGHEFLSGIPSYYLKGGEVYKAQEGGAKKNWNINLSTSQVEDLLKQIEPHMEVLSNPPKEDGKSILKGYQLVVWFKEGALLSVNKEEKGYGGKATDWMNWVIDPGEIESITLVVHGSSEWVSVGTRATVESAYDYIGLQLVGGKTLGSVEDLKTHLDGMKPKQTGVFSRLKRGQSKSLTDEGEKGEVTPTKPLVESLDG